MDAITLLKEQHREVEELFRELEQSSKGAVKTRERLVRRLADSLAVHSALEEEFFYQESKAQRTELLLLKALEEHLACKRLLADLLELEATAPTFVPKLLVLRDLVLSHVDVEERELMPRAARALGKERLEALGAQMEARARQLLDDGEPRERLPAETDAAPPLH
jgi:hemerythrin-like domain-containing protein